MKVADELTPAEIRTKAREWYDRQCEISKMALGPRWPLLRDFVEAYLKQEIKERLIARGWRPK